MSDLPDEETGRIQQTITYTDGFGRELQTKLRTEPGPTRVRQADDTYKEQEVEERWISSGQRQWQNTAAKSNPLFRRSRSR